METSFRQLETPVVSNLEVLLDYTTRTLEVETLAGKWATPSLASQLLRYSETPAGSSPSTGSEDPSGNDIGIWFCRDRQGIVT